jgi:cell division protease FtsH
VGERVSKQVTPPPPGDRPPRAAPPPPPAWRHWLWLVSLVIAVVLWFVLPTEHTSQVSLSYSQFLSDLAAKHVKTITLGPSGQASTGTLTNGSHYTTVVPSQAGSALLDRLQAAHVQITAATASPSFGSQVFSWVIILLPIVLLRGRAARGARRGPGARQGLRHRAAADTVRRRRGV